MLDHIGPDTHLGSPLFKGLRTTVQSYETVGRTVICLLPDGDPSAVPGLISAIVAHTVYREPGLVTVCIGPILERIKGLAPLLTYGDPAATILRIVLTPGIMAAADHPAIDIIQRPVTHDLPRLDSNSLIIEMVSLSSGYCDSRHSNVTCMSLTILSFR